MRQSWHKSAQLKCAGDRHEGKKRSERQRTKNNCRTDERHTNKRGQDP